MKESIEIFVQLFQKRTTSRDKSFSDELKLKQVNAFDLPCHIVASTLLAAVSQRVDGDVAKLICSPQSRQAKSKKSTLTRSIFCVSRNNLNRDVFDALRLLFYQADILSTRFHSAN